MESVYDCTNPGQDYMQNSVIFFIENELSRLTEA
jgi:hypothetical protein